MDSVKTMGHSRGCKFEGECRGVGMREKVVDMIKMHWIHMKVYKEEKENRN